MAVKECFCTVIHILLDCFKDIEQNQVVVVRRDTREKIVVSLDEIETKLGEILETIQKDMYAFPK